MEANEIVLLAVTLIILGEVTFLLTKLPRTNLKTKRRALLIDTSVLMDGRIAAVAKTGFIGDTLVIPRSVVGELQFLADHADGDKRARARYGLDVVTELQSMEEVEVELLQDGSKAKEGVDERLLKLAKQHDAWICTIDYNLNKVAVVEGIRVLNINELAQSIRMEHLPGEHMMLELVQKGQESHQGVGYMPDGTMVVVEQASAQIGKTVEVEIIRNLQTAAGRMMFARRIEQQVKSNPKIKQVLSSKTTGRKQTQPKQRNHKESHEVQHSHNVEAENKKARQSVRNSADASKTVKNPRRKRVDHEAALINLVDRQ
ncbi:MAG: TRAM domain-containing protein [Candidatus Saccharimonas sp.]